MLAIKNDDELNKLKMLHLADGGVLPGIAEELIPRSKSKAKIESS